MSLLEDSGLSRTPNHDPVTTTLPKFDEEYFQWIDLLEAVFLAQREFTMIELGAGYGRWLVNAAAALRSFNDLPLMLIGVEAEPTHFRWMKDHIKDNGIEESHCQLWEAAADADDRDVNFLVGRPSRWYGQSIWPPETRTVLPPKIKLIMYRLQKKVKRVRTISLRTLLQPFDCVDLIDLDVQGSEFKILASAPSQLEMKVKRVHIGTHGKQIESALKTLFQKLEWKCNFDYPCGSEEETPWGRISFQDGVQSWINPDMENKPQ